MSLSCFGRLIFRSQFAELTLNICGNLVKESQSQRAECVYHHGDHELFTGGPVNSDLVEGVRSETTDQQAKALVDPGCNNEDSEGPGQQLLVVTQFGRDEQCKADNSAACSSPHPGYQFVVAVAASEEVCDGVNVSRHIGVECGEDFKQEEENVHTHCVSDNSGKCSDCFFAWIVAGDLANNKQYEEQNSGSGAERRCQKAGSQNSGEPVVAAGQTCVQERGYGVDGECPDNGSVNQRFNPFGVRHALAVTLKAGPADNNVQDEVSVQNDHIPEEDGVRSRMEHNVQHTLRLSDVDDNETETHDNSSNSHEFTHDDHAFELLVVMEVVRQYDHNTGCGETDQIGELSNIEAPGYITVETGDGHTFLKLGQIYAETGSNNEQQETNPGPVLRSAS